MRTSDKQQVQEEKKKEKKKRNPSQNYNQGHSVKLNTSNYLHMCVILNLDVKDFELLSRFRPFTDVPSP